MKYYRITNGLNSIGDFIKVTDNPYNYIKSQDNDYYLSLYEYSEEQKNDALEIIEVEKKGKKYNRPRGVVGVKNVITKKLVFDFDNESDIELARLDTITAGERLKDYGISELDMKVSFSGGKGFSIVVDHNTELTPEEHKAVAKKIAGDLKTFDTTVYNANRIFRVDYTKHNKTGLYKTPLFFQNLKTLNIDKIKNMAKNKKAPKYKNKPVELPKELTKIEAKKETKDDIPKLKKENLPIDFSKKPYYLTDVKYVLHQGYIPKGYGNMGMMILAATYKHVGFDKTDAYHMLKGVNEKRSQIHQIEKRENEEIWNEVIETVYDDLWAGGTYSVDNNELLAKVAKEYDINEKDVKVNTPITLSNVTDIFSNFAENIDKNTIKLGIPTIDEEIKVTTSMLVCLLAAPSAGKSSITFNILNNLSRNNIDGLFLSLDMGAPLVYLRLAQKHTGLDSKEVYDMFKNNKEKKAELAKKLEEQYQNIHFSFKSGILMSDIRDMLDGQIRSGRNPKFLAIDYLECLAGPYSDSTQNKAYIAQSLKDIANDYGICVFLLVQPQKYAGDPSFELNSYRNIKGSSVIEEAASVIFTIHRPGFNPKSKDDDKFMNITVVKNRMGPLGTYDFAWEGLTGDIQELDEWEKEELKKIKKKVQESRKNNGDI